MGAPTSRPEDSPLAGVQRAFAAHLRDPASHPAPPDVDPRRMQVYRELVYANVESLLGTGFPVLRSLLADPVWHALVRDFLAHHRATTPLFPRLARELIAYLEGERRRPASEPPFLLELARYEWLETELLLSEAAPDDDDVDPHGDLLEGLPVVSPLARWLRAAWPVHRLRASEPPPTRPDRETCLALCRGGDERVRFMELTPITLTLLERLASDPTRSGRDQLERLAREVGRRKPAAFVEQGSRVLEALRDRGVLIGARRTTGPSSSLRGERP
ncbi:MAG: putative DNA-binding domain-containing protein [Myxococcota bacterium]